MITIKKANEEDCRTIAEIGKISVGDAHRASCSAEDMNAFLELNYNENSVREELKDAGNLYYLIEYNNVPAGFSKIVLNDQHPNIERSNVTKLDRIYLLKEFHGLKLGWELMNYNIQLAKQNSQSGIWLFTWIGNKKAIEFYTKLGFKIIGNHHFKVTETHYNENHHMFLDFGEPENL
jgi:ribosomal protein S18 acetylase RimI-like enzyme